jgi:hypothetical protein
VFSAAMTSRLSLTRPNMPSCALIIFNPASSKHRMATVSGTACAGSNSKGYDLAMVTCLLRMLLGTSLVEERKPRAIRKG